MRIVSRYFLGLLVVLSVFCLPACRRHHDPVLRPILAKEFTDCYIRSYGEYYPSSSVSVFSFDLYSEGLTLDSVGLMQGTGTNVYLSDVFAPLGAALPPAGAYAMDTTAAPFTLLPGRHFDARTTGAYSLLVENERILSLTLYADTLVEIDYRDDTLDLTLRFKSYRAHYRGVPHL